MRGPQAALARSGCIRFGIPQAACEPRQVLRVDLTKPLQAFELEGRDSFARGRSQLHVVGRLAYLLTEGRLQAVDESSLICFGLLPRKVMNFEGQREQVYHLSPKCGTSSSFPGQVVQAPTAKTTCMDAKASTVLLS